MASIYSEGDIIAGTYKLIGLLQTYRFYEEWKAVDSSIDDNQVPVTIRFYIPGKKIEETELKTFLDSVNELNIKDSKYLVPFKYIEWKSLPVRITPFYSRGNAGIKAGKLRTSEAIQFIQDSSAALCELHSQGSSFLHYDLKPEDFVIDNQGNFMLTDYEITPSMQSMLILKSGYQGVSFGRPAFKAPEQFNRASKDNHIQKSNIFGLGAIFYYLLTDKLPYGELGGIMIQKNTPVPELPDKWLLFNDILNSMLSKDAALRPDANGVHAKSMELASSKMADYIKIPLRSILMVLAGVILLAGSYIVVSQYILKGKISVTHTQTTPEPATNAPTPENTPETTSGNNESENKENKSNTDIANIATPVPVDWVLVEGGVFTMGESAVKLSSYHISKYEVTVAQFRAFCESTGREMPYEPQWGWQDDYPVVRVTWHDANAFAMWMGCRLPTETEWEFAAKGGKKSQGYTYSGSNNIDEVAWHPGNAEARPHKTGSKKPNELGIYDMSGNVWEWCSDWYSENTRSLRGGSFYFDNTFGRVSHRHNSYPDLISLNVGFRIAK